MNMHALHVPHRSHLPSTAGHAVLLHTQPGAPEISYAWHIHRTYGSAMLTRSAQLTAGSGKPLLSAELTVKASAIRTQGQQLQSPPDLRPILSCTPVHLYHTAGEPDPDLFSTPQLAPR